MTETIIIDRDTQQRLVQTFDGYGNPRFAIVEETRPCPVDVWEVPDEEMIDLSQYPKPPCEKSPSAWRWITTLLVIGAAACVLYWVHGVLD